MQGNNICSVTPDIENLDYIIATKTVLFLGYSRDDVNRAFQICNRDCSKLSSVSKSENFENTKRGNQKP